MTKMTWPDKDVMCHRTGFTKSCFECVKEHGCRLWKHVSLEGDPRLPPGAAQSAVDHWDCADSLADLYLRDMLRRQLQTTATVDELRKEVRESNAGAMGAILGSVNQQLRILQTQTQTQDAIAHSAPTSPKLIGNGGAHADADA
jgi:hypothetical protein